MIAVLGMQINDLYDLLKTRRQEEGEIANDNVDGQVI